jgi:hypothetical protein
MLSRLVVFLFVFIASARAYCQPASSKPNSAKLIVLGVTHSAQLVNPAFQPGALRAFIKKCNPKAICIERSPTNFSRNDFYEFTYEQQFCIIPFARENKIPVFPFDWEPNPEDLGLSFGISDLENPPFARSKQGFMSFLNFDDSISTKGGLFYADDPAYPETLSGWYKTYPEKANFDFARRLFLYRTFLQAKRIEKIADNFRNDTILVVVGSYHKDDIEKILSEDGYELVRGAMIGQPGETDIRNNTNLQDAFAISSFNLLGTQSNSGINIPFVEENVKLLEQKAGNAASSLFRILLDLAKKKITLEQAIPRFTQLMDLVPNDLEFSWTGVKNRQRIDSYFDPFGNMKVRQRILVELARAYHGTGKNAEYERTKSELLEEFVGFKRALLNYYLADFIESRK